MHIKINATSKHWLPKLFHVVWQRDLPDDEEQKLRELIKKAHDVGLNVRIWGCPNRVEVWKRLLNEGTDWINVDDLKA